MNDWSELAMDDIFDELEELSERGRQELNIEPECIDEEIVEEEDMDEKERCGPMTKKEVPFCCTTTIPKDFDVRTGTGEIAWKNCLKCVKVFQTIEATCDEESGDTCSIPACVLRIVGCIPFIASARVKGDIDYNNGSSTSTSDTRCPKLPSQSEISCSCCLCVDKCVRCFPLRRFGAPQCSRERDVRIGLKGNVDVCCKDCVPCPPSTEESECQTVTFSGILEVWCRRGLM